jgi:tetratricopeptide (TPR) repeat protein
MSMPQNLRFTDAKSFRLFTEGVQALQAYERNAKQEALDTAAERFNECVSNYRDVLPRLYLGMVRVYQGESFEEAAALLQDVLNRDIDELRSTAKYYLAEAHVSTYRVKDIERADELLLEVLEDTKASPFDHLRAEALRTFNYIRQKLWRNRTTAIDLKNEEAEATKRLVDFKKHLVDEKAEDDLKASLWADYWNADGLWQEFLANRTQDVEARKSLIQSSLEGFRKALEYGANRADAKSNEARVQYELLHDAEAATRLCREVLAIRKDDSFANLLLGKIAEDSGRFSDAVGFYLKAQAKFPETTVRVGACYARLGNVQEALEVFARVPNSDRRFGEANFRTAALYQELGKTDEALKAYKLVPKDDEVFFQKAQNAIAELEKKN